MRSPAHRRTGTHCRTGLPARNQQTDPPLRDLRHIACSRPDSSPEPPSGPPSDGNGPHLTRGTPAMIVDTAPPPSPVMQRPERSLWWHTAPTLVIRVGGSDLRLHAGQSYTIGRDPECDVVIADSRVSRRHAVVRFAPGGWVFQDAGSANGTFLGDSRVDSSQISSDCLFRLGNPQDGPVVLCFVIHPEPGGTAVTALRGASPSANSPTVTVHRAPVRVLRIGRAADNDLVLADSGISRYHAELRNPGDGMFEITDLRSRNGIFVNGERISSAAVTERDIIGIGRAAFRIVGDKLRELADGERISAAAVTGPDTAGTGSTESRAVGDRAAAWLRTRAPARPPLREVGVATATSLCGPAGAGRDRPLAPPAPPDPSARSKHGSHHGGVGFADSPASQRDRRSADLRRGRLRRGRSGRAGDMGRGRRGRSRPGRHAPAASRAFTRGGDSGDRGRHRSACGPLPGPAGRSHRPPGRVRRDRRPDRGKSTPSTGGESKPWYRR